MAKIAYLVHDTADAAVARRVRMFQAGGAQVAVAGFHRRSSPAAIAGAPVTDLGRTADARLAARAGAVLRHVLRPAIARAHVRGADAIVARHLETLAIAVRVAAPGQRVVFECLDIHRLLLADGIAGRLLLAIETRLLARTALIVTSSPAFAESYFRARRGISLPIRIEENKVLALDGAVPGAIAPPSGPPWRIGWFGMLRCARSLAILRALVMQSDGAIEVLIAGVPAYTEFDDFDRDVTGVPGLRFVGSYRPDDLAALYGEVHFAWAIDYFEAGLNSTWLLPNRLYESLAHGAVPIALGEVETGRWLVRHGAGVIVDDPAVELAALLPDLSAERYETMRAAVAAVPRAALIAGPAEATALTRAVLEAAL